MRETTPLSVSIFSHGLPSYGQRNSVQDLAWESKLTTNRQSNDDHENVTLEGFTFLALAVTMISRRICQAGHGGDMK
jgi:hypothetical protein